MSLLIASSLLIPLTFGGLSTSNPVYQRAIAIGNYAGQLAGQHAAAAENSCMSGTPLENSKAQKAQMASHGRILSYWAAAREATQPHLSSNFDPKGARWSSGSSEVEIAPASRVADPLSLAGAVIATAPVSFTVAGDGDSAMGQWEVRGATGALLGTYQVRLREFADSWLISSLEIVPAQSFVEPLIRYCHTPGDVINHLMVNAKTSVELAEKALAEKLEREKAARGTPKQESAQRKAIEAGVALESARRQAASVTAKIVAIQQERSARQTAFQASKR